MSFLVLILSFLPLFSTNITPTAFAEFDPHIEIEYVDYILAIGETARFEFDLVIEAHTEYTSIPKGTLRQMKCSLQHPKIEDRRIIRAGREFRVREVYKKYTNILDIRRGSGDSSIDFVNTYELFIEFENELRLICYLEGKSEQYRNGTSGFMLHHTSALRFPGSEDLRGALEDYISLPYAGNASGIRDY